MSVLRNFKKGFIADLDLLLQRDRASILSIQRLARMQAGDAAQSPISLSLPTLPFSAFSLTGAVALYDYGYAKYESVFRLILATGQQILFQASSESAMNDWIALINYTAAFHSTGLAITSMSALLQERLSEDNTRAFGSRGPVLEAAMEFGKLRSNGPVKTAMLSSTMPNTGLRDAVSSPELASSAALPEEQSQTGRHSFASAEHERARTMNPSGRRAALHVRNLFTALKGLADITSTSRLQSRISMCRSRRFKGYSRRL